MVTGRGASEVEVAAGPDPQARGVPAAADAGLGPQRGVMVVDDTPSALQDTECRVEGLRVGAVHLVSEPFQVEELLARFHNPGCKRLMDDREVRSREGAGTRIRITKYLRV